VRAARSARHLTLDAGALVAYDRDASGIRELIGRALAAGIEVTVPAGVLAQVWRGGRRQAMLAALLKKDGVTVVDLTEPGARASGELCGESGTRDVIDASVIVCARERRDATVLTSDPADMRRLDPRLDVQAV